MNENVRFLLLLMHETKLDDVEKYFKLVLQPIANSGNVSVKSGTLNYT